MKPTVILVSILAALAWSIQAADTSVKLSDVHLCCGGCVKNVEKAVATVPGAAVVSDKDAGTVNITAPDQATAQKAVDALVAGGFFGKSGNPDIKVKDKSGAKKGKIQTLKVTGVHLCCAHCVSSVNDALAKVSGVKANTAAKGATSFDVTGDFKAKDVFKALNKAGFAGKAG